MTPVTVYPRVIDAINLNQPMLDDTSSTKEAAKGMGEIMNDFFSSLASDKMLLNYFEKVARSLVEDCAEDDWDERGSKEINLRSLNKAKEFCINLQVSYPGIMPRIVVEADGHIMLTWRKNRNLVTVIVQDSDWIIFSSIVSEERLNGILPFVNGKIPQIIINKINALDG